MKPWQREYGELYNDVYGCSLKTENAMGRDQEWSRARIIQECQRPMLLLQDKQNPTLAARTIVAWMVEDGIWNWKQPDEDRARVLMEPPTKAGERRGLVSRRRDLEPSVMTVDAIEYLQQNIYQINQKVWEKMLKVGDCPGFLQAEVERVFEHRLPEAPLFYCDWMLDWRTRMYVNAYGTLNFQGDHFNRGLVRWGKAYKIGDNFHAFASVLLDEYGVTKENYKDIIENFVAYRKENDMDYKVLDAAFAMEEVLETGETSYIIQQDATCSGFQHIACLTGDEALAEVVNVLASKEARSDLYMAVVDAFMAEGGYWAEYLSRINRKLIRKDLAKDTVMLSGYGSTAEPIALKFLGYDGKAKYVNEDGEMTPCEHNYDLVKKAVDQGQKVVFLPKSILREAFKGLTPEQMMDLSLDLAVTFQATLFKKYPAIKGFIDMLKEHAKSFYKEFKKCVEWVNPVGTKIYDLPWKVDDRGETETISYTKEGKKYRVNILKLRHNNKKSGFPPCFIHSFDAALVIHIILQAKKAGIPVAPIHDSLGTSVEHMHMMPKFYGRGMADIYNDKDHLKDQFGMKLKQDSFTIDPNKAMIF